MRPPLKAVISTPTLPWAAIALSLAWFICAWLFYLTNRESKDSLSGAPLWIDLFLTLLPFIAATVTFFLWKERRSAGQRLNVVDYCAFAATAAPFALVGALVLLSYLANHRF